MSEDGGQRGYFSPESAVWRIARESVLMLGGGYALLMQAAHPLVAAGIVAHSSFRESPWRRLAGTMSAIYAVVYGTRAEADRAADRVRAIHAGVQGSIPAHLGLSPAGTRYAAYEPRLLLWVHGTLVDTALVMHETFVRPLGEEQRQAFYEDMKVVAQLFGTPACWVRKVGSACKSAVFAHSIEFTHPTGFCGLDRGARRCAPRREREPRSRSPPEPRARRRQAPAAASCRRAS